MNSVVDAMEAGLPFLTSLPSDWEYFPRPPLTLQRPDLALLHGGDRLILLLVRDWTDEVVSDLIEEGQDHLKAWRDSEELREISSSELIADFQQLLVCWNHVKDHFGIRITDVSNFDRVRAALQTGLALPRIESKENVDRLRSALDGLAALAPLGTPFRGIHRVEMGIHPVLGGRDLLSLNAILERVPNHPERGSRLLDDDLSARLRSLLVLPDMEERRRRPLRLDAHQMRFSTTRTETGYRRIEGPAGSGKTLILAARAAHLAAEGKRVLVLSFNITLHRYIREMYERHCATLQVDARTATTNVKFIHFHGYLKELAEQFPNTSVEWARITHPERQGPRPDTAAMVQIAHVALRQLRPTPHGGTFDAVLVDEGQDWDPDWWSIVTESVAKGGECLLVSDVTQDLYGHADSWSSQVLVTKGFRGEPAKLTQSYRIHPKLARVLTDFIANMMGGEGLPPISQQEAFSLDVDPTLRWVLTRPELVAETAAREIDEAYKTIRSLDPLAMPDVFFSTDDHATGAAVAYRLESLGHTVQDVFRTDDWITDKKKKLDFGSSLESIKGTTVHSMKGWETRAVIATFQADSHDEEKYQDSLIRLYVAMSRLKSFAAGSILTIISSSSDLSSFFESRGFFVERDLPHSSPRGAA